MTIPFRPILSALLRNRVGAILVAGQIAIALGVLVNAVYIVKQRMDLIGRPTGIDVENIFVVSATAFGRNLNYVGMLQEDLGYLQSLPGVIGATTSNAVPLSGSGSSDYVKRRPDEMIGRSSLVNYFEVTDRAVDALGLQLSAGRWFTANEVVPPPKVPFGPYGGPVVITRGYAEKMFPNESPLGKTLYESRGNPLTIIGVVDHMLGSWLIPGQGTSDDIMYIPRLATGPGVPYLVRTKPGMRDTVMRQVEKDMAQRNRARSVDYVRPLDLYVKRSYMLDRNMAIYLSIVTTMLLVITSLGIFGLATFNVSTRTKQVGTRRAVGARRRDVVLHFLAENWMITTGGVVLGSVLALIAGHLLSIEYRLPRVDLYYIVGGVLVLWAVGLAAAWYPARRAARISPALATRTV
jgi:putative ABC transport system permease protein